MHTNPATVQSLYIQAIRWPWNPWFIINHPLRPYIEFELVSVPLNRKLQNKCLWQEGYSYLMLYWMNICVSEGLLTNFLNFKESNTRSNIKLLKLIRSVNKYRSTCLRNSIVVGLSQYSNCTNPCLLKQWLARSVLSKSRLVENKLQR